MKYFVYFCNSSWLIATILGFSVLIIIIPSFLFHREPVNKRILATCECLKFRLQSLIDEGGDCPQIEPYITSMALYDARHGRKLTENFYFDLNHELIRKHVKYTPKSPEPVDKSSHNNNNHHSSTTAEEFLAKLPDQFLTYPKQAMFNLVVPPHPDIFIVVRIDKILQGNINQVSRECKSINRWKFY